MMSKPDLDDASLSLLEEALRAAMMTAAGRKLDSALVDLGWRDMLDEIPDLAIPMVFRLLGETGSHAPVINDVVLNSAGQRAGATVPLPYAGASWVVWERGDAGSVGALDSELPIARTGVGDPVPLAAGRRALGWWLVGCSRAMLALACQHALDRWQFGRPLASFQAVRHRLAETLVGIEGAVATLMLADDELSSLLAKAAAGEAAMTTARHCQQVLGGIGFTAEHEFHRHLRHALLLEGLLGNARELMGQAGTMLRENGSAPHLVNL